MQLICATKLLFYWIFALEIGDVTVIDGDTVQLGKTFCHRRVRLSYIDAPELKQLSCEGRAIGVESKNYLRELIGTGPIELSFKGLDRYGRILAELSREKHNLNQLMVLNGYALYYPFNRKVSVIYSALSYRAKRSRSGILSDYCFMTPKNYRRNRRSGKISKT